MINDGDVYAWRWKDDKRNADLLSFGSYHCKSQIAVAHSGKLYDTFWGGYPKGGLNQEDILITFRGNLHEMKEISYWEIACYLRKDIVDMRHSNNTRAKVYIQKDAERDAETMLSHITGLMEDSENDIRQAENRISLLLEDLATVRAGRLNEVLF